MKPLAETIKGDRVVFFKRGVPESGTVMRVKKDGTRTIKPDCPDPINEYAWVDVRPRT